MWLLTMREKKRKKRRRKKKIMGKSEMETETMGRMEIMWTLIYSSKKHNKKTRRNLTSTTIEVALRIF